jgi:hypothetical protein
MANAFTLIMGNMKKRPAWGKPAGGKYIWSSPAVTDVRVNAKT